MSHPDPISSSSPICLLDLNPVCVVECCRLSGLLGYRGHLGDRNTVGRVGIKRRSQGAPRFLSNQIFVFDVDQSSGVRLWCCFCTPIDGSEEREVERTASVAPHPNAPEDDLPHKMKPKGTKEKEKVRGSEGDREPRLDPKGTERSEDREPRLSPTEWKEKGNKSFLGKKYDDAILCYTQAIRKEPSVATYFTNRALAYLKLGNWTGACKDCRMAMDLDPTSVKAHYFMSQALIEMEQYDDAIHHLQRAFDLAQKYKMNYGDDIAALLRLARRRRWDAAESVRVSQEIELQSKLTKLLVEDKNRHIEALMEASSNGVSTEKLREIQDLETQCDKEVEELNSLFAKVDDRRKKREVPDYLAGRISFEILQDPVITPSGVTYERKDIEEHLQRVGHFDPVTRSPLTRDKLIPNLAMQEVVESFLTDNEWALEEYN
ncbi:unnamed protein product [Cyprideis torosa]|uniref:E3 ubiquitin-protein ligase CHIP n=1 Tax=Cyprideis torosa TaxID=163714 RepID=A0A7R8WFV3_9CRUS|nr:unnamed protein product [Cyprideis torosa]CAG0897477.1 unnamed protein product [Cyprideis torosa]